MMRPVDLVAAALAAARSCRARCSGRSRLSASPSFRPAGGPCCTRSPRVCPCAGTPARDRFPPGSMASVVDDDRAPSRSTPEIVTVSAATAYHEAIEAIRWARELIASGTADPADIAIASVTPADYDDHFLALRADANLDLHFVHGVKITASREGQAAAALADILVRGLSQTRMRRLAALLAAYPGPFQALPRGLDARPAGRCPARVAPGLDPPARPSDAPTIGPTESTMVRRCATSSRCCRRASPPPTTIGEALLHGRALAIWRKALLAGPAASLDLTLETLKQDDGLDACVSVAWMPASALGGIAAPLRSAARAQLLALAARHFGGSPALRSHHPDRRTRSASGRRRRSAGLRRPSSPRRSARSSCRARGATAMADSSAAARCCRGSPTKSICGATGCRITPSARPID